MNQQILSKILGEYDIKNPSRQVKSALQEFAFKYAQKLLLKTQQVAGSEKITDDHLKVAYDLIHNIHTTKFELAQEKHEKQFIRKLNTSDNQLKFSKETLTVKLPIYALRSSVTNRDTQLGML